MKKTDIAFNLAEIEMLLNALDTLEHETQFSPKEQKLFDKLEQVFEEYKDQLEEDSHYVEDKDGFNTFKADAYEGLAEKYGTKE